MSGFQPLLRGLAFDLLGTVAVEITASAELPLFHVPLLDIIHRQVKAADGAEAL